MKIAALQAQASIMGVTANLRVIDEAAQEAASNGADVLLTPELFLSGYAPRTVAKAFTPTIAADARDKVAAIAARHRIALAVSMPTPSESGKVYIGAYLYSPAGEQLLHFRKVHLFGPDEKASFAASSKPPKSVNLNGVRLGMVICYDVEFPEAVRAVVDAGADVVLVPTALTAGYDAVSSILLPARSLENHVTIAYANHTGHEDGLDFGGNSVIVGPLGETLARGSESREIIYADYDPDAATAATQDVPYIPDRRPGLYERWREQLRGS